MLKTTHPKTRKAWRQWLEKNHDDTPGVWMIYYKKETGKRQFGIDEAVEEALCFGWIDSQALKLDSERTMQKFTPRKPKSVWSKINKARVAKLIKNDLMRPSGFDAIKEAKKNGSWDALTSSDTHTSNNSVPVPLLKALSKSKKALENFKAFPPGYRKRFLFWIDSAKRPETKAARIEQTVLMAAANKKPGLKGFKL